ncbi:MAG: hypothetical protein ACREGD_04960 [Candidatus Saccharimonadales bacterium]
MRRESLQGALRAQLGEPGHFRIYAKHLERDGLVDEKGRDAGHDWDMTRGGFRIDWVPTADNTVMVQGDFTKVISIRVSSCPQ